MWLLAHQTEVKPLTSNKPQEGVGADAGAGSTGHGRRNGLEVRKNGLEVRALTGLGRPPLDSPPCR